MLDLKDLHCFVCVYDLKASRGRLSNSATVQSNVSARHPPLEAEIGARLFERLHRSIRPPPRGKSCTGTPPESLPK